MNSLSSSQHTGGHRASTTVHWVLHPSSMTGLVKLAPESNEEHVPQMGEVFERPFFVDSVTHCPVPVRVIQRLDWAEAEASCCVVVVGPENTG